MKLISNLHAAHQIMRAEVAKHTDLAPTQALVLATLDGQDGISQTDICNKAPIDRSTLADTVRRLLKSGHLTRKRTRADARRYAVTLIECETYGRDDIETLLITARSFGATLAVCLFSRLDADKKPPLRKIGGMLTEEFSHAVRMATDTTLRLAKAKEAMT